MPSGSLNQKRVLVTDIDTDFGKEIANALVAEGALTFCLVKKCQEMQQVLEISPQVTPVLLDISKEKGEEQARKLILSLPTIDHFVNLSGDSPFNILTQAYPNSKVHEISDAKVKPIVAKMAESGNRSCIFHVTLFGTQNIMSKLKANLDPRFTNSKTAQFSTNVRQSLKKMFSSNSGGESSSKNAQQTTTTRTEEVIIRETQVASSFAAVATTINQSQPQTASSTSAQNGNATSTTTPSGNGAASGTSNTTSTTPSARIQSLQDKNAKIRQGVLKLQKTCAKKWRKNEKRIAKEQQNALKTLTKDIERTKKVEKANLMKSISDANDSTRERSAALSTDTANRIQEARNKRADKEVEKHAQKKLETETPKILEENESKLQEYSEKLYKKMVEREITEFNRIKSKYLV